MVSRYVSNGSVKQEGICLLPPPHYRMIPPQHSNFLGRPATPQRQDVFQLTQPQQYLPQPPNPAGNQNQLRAMGPPGGPPQSSTPPAELKVSHGNQSQVSMSYIRHAPHNLNFRGPAPQPQTQRMPNAPRTSQMGPMYTTGPNSMYVQPCYYNNYARQPVPAPYIQTPPMNYAYPPGQYYIRAAVPPQIIAPMPQNIAHPPQPVQHTQPPHYQTKEKSRNNAIPIIHPVTGIQYIHDKNSEGSNDSSVRHSPQPATQNAHTKEVQVAFAKGVAQTLNDDVQEEHAEIIEPQIQPSMQPLQQHPEPPINPLVFHGNPPISNANRNELVNCSKLQVPKKDFVPANMSNLKETPVVSAISNAEERTIVNKQNKDKESPAKGRKRSDQSIPKEKEPVKEKEVSVEKPVKEEKAKEAVAPPLPVQKETREKDKEEKKKLKTEAVERKITKEEEVEVVTPNTENAKPKQNSQKGSKDAQKQGGGPTKQQVTVPQSQPAKPSNKNNKMKELNMKGANKEGTDMDAFSDNLDVLNANVSTATVPETTGVQTTPANQNANIICDSNKTTTESNETPTIKPEIKTLPTLPKNSGRVEVTSIVKEVPKPFVLPAALENKDEIERTSMANDKLVQAKNEVNAKANVDNDNKLALPYKDNQWSPFNQDGSKVYEKDFLMALRNFPMSKQKPDNLLNDILAQDDKTRIGDVSKYGMNQRTDFAPNFGGGSSFPGKSQSHKSSSNKSRVKGSSIGGNSSKGGKSNSIRLSFSFKEDVKLHETENAWKPTRFDPQANQTDEDKQSEELYKKVRGVLNKLTPQKFQTLVGQIKSLPVTTPERLQGVINLVFEKAVDEPNFSVAYALMCKELALMQVPTTAGGKEYANFRKLIISRCQVEFEKDSYVEGKRNERFKEVEACQDPVKKKELMLSLDEEDRRIRMKSVGNIRFIGELFKQGMLTSGIMERCLYHLLENRDEERLECLCKLLTTIGAELKKVDLSKIFDTMKEIADKKNTKISSRIRFMLQDVIDLRNNNWVSRRQDMNPKTMDQIQKEAANEQLTIQAMNSGPITPRKDDRGSSMNSDRKRGGRNNTNEDGWSTQNSRKNQFSIQCDKFKIYNKHSIEAHEVLGSVQTFNCWGSGSQVKSNKNINSNPNPYAPLMEEGGNIMDMRPNSSRTSKDNYNSKRSSMERQYKQYDGRSSRSGSQHRSNESSERSTPTPAQQMHTFKAPQPVQPQLAEDILHNMIASILDEYVFLGDAKSICDEIKNDVPHSQLDAALNEIFNVALDKTPECRIGAGKLLIELIVRKYVTMDCFCRILVNVFSMYHEFIVDIPNIWEYYAEIISPLINEGVLPLTKLHKCCAAFLIPEKKAQKLLAPVFKLVIQEKGPLYLEEIWKESKLKLQDFMDADAVDEFVSKNKFAFLIGGSGETFVDSNLTYPQIQEKINQFIKKNTSFDAHKKWISANLGERVKEKEFIRVLMTAILENSIEKDYKLNLDKFRSFNNFFSYYVENNMEYELQCLHAVHALLYKLQHPQGLLLDIFSALYDENIVSQDTFIKWETAPDDIVEKGVVLKQLTSFFTQLKENDDDDDCSE